MSVVLDGGWGGERGEGETEFDGPYAGAGAKVQDAMGTVDGCEVQFAFKQPRCKIVLEILATFSIEAWQGAFGFIPSLLCSC
jgi:hypothetical protein